MISKAFFPRWALKPLKAEDRVFLWHSKAARHDLREAKDPLPVRQAKQQTLVPVRFAPNSRARFCEQDGQRGRAAAKRAGTSGGGGSGRGRKASAADGGRPVTALGGSPVDQAPAGTSAGRDPDAPAMGDACQVASRLGTVADALNRTLGRLGERRLIHFDAEALGVSLAELVGRRPAGQS